MFDFDRAACNSPSNAQARRKAIDDLALAFTGGGYFDYMGKPSHYFNKMSKKS